MSSTTDVGLCAPPGAVRGPNLLARLGEAFAIAARERLCAWGASCAARCGHRLGSFDARRSGLARERLDQSSR